MGQTDAKHKQLIGSFVSSLTLNMGQTDVKRKKLIGSFVSTIKHGLPPGSLHYPHQIV